MSLKSLPGSTHVAAEHLTGQSLIGSGVRWDPNPSLNKTGSANYFSLLQAASGDETPLYLNSNIQSLYKFLLNISRERPDQIEVIFLFYLRFLYQTFPRKGICDLIESSSDFYNYYLEAQNHIHSEQSEVTTVKITIDDI